MAEVQVLTLSCEDRPGITARVTGHLFEQGGNILEAQQFNDPVSGAFFLRVEFDHGGDAVALRSGFAPLASEYGMRWELRAKTRPRKVLLLVSKFDHCLGDLLYRNRIGSSPMRLR
ncbi:MAG: ACT domain-containing protein [Alphaproteobacteria bacterium]|nr:MAG: ACT domain-containing protein [Alphaproteobacteria bacterium]